MDQTNDWTAYYAPKNDSFHESGFSSQTEAEVYIESRTDLDEHAWFVLETKYYKNCNDFRDIMAAAGFRPSKIRIEYWNEYVKRCKRIGCPVLGEKDEGSVSTESI